jgi:type I restriction enzyme, S subunit
VLLATPKIKFDQIDFENVNFITEFRYEESPELKLQVGDVLLVKDGNTLGITNVIRDLPRPATVNGSIAVIRSRTMVPSFLRYVIASDFLQGRIAAYRAGMGVPHLFQADIKKFPLPQPPLAQQQAIADYLDAETDRIDGIVLARTRQLALIGERLEVEAATLLHAARAPLVALRRVVDLLPGFSYRSEDFLPDPAYARLLRGINVDVGSLRWDDTVWVDDRVATTTSRFALADRDIVMGMDRPVISSGVRLAQVTAADLPARLVQRVARLRARPGLSQEYLYAALRGPALARYFAPLFTGVSVPHVSPSQILGYEIPVPPAPQQDKIVQALDAMEERARRHQAAARHQIELLLERRQALITAAVTGQLDIPGVAA